MMSRAEAPAHLPDAVIERARAQADGPQQTAPHKETADAAPGETPAAAPPAFAVKRSRAKGFAIAACAVLAVGAALLAAGPISAALDGGGDAPAAVESTNFFQMVAFADEGAQAANGVATLTAKDFAPARSGVGPRYDPETSSYPGDVDASRFYNLDLTCTGSNVTSMTYELQGKGVDFFNWELTHNQDPTSDAPSVTGATGTRDSSFTVDYANQDIDSAEAVHHEICLNYPLEGDLRAAWDKFHTNTERERVPGTMPEDERLAQLEARNQFELALARHDAEVIANARIVLTATFADGTTQTKTYRIAPVDDFDAAYRTYLDAQEAADGTTAPDYPVLYTIQEVA